MAYSVKSLICRSRYLALPPATGDLPECGGCVISSYAAAIPKPIEHAGHVYQQRLCEMYCTDAANSSTDGSEPDITSKAETANKSRGAASGSELQRKLATDGDDLYALLELGDKRWHATADEIKKSFRRISLLYHPDKLRHKVSHLGEEAIAETESHFKKVMKAYDILSDKKKRAAYDSIDDVDDTIPEEDEVNDDNFYELVGERFAINARWSVSDRVPLLGNDSTLMSEVHDFYNFWYSFKTWRDFSFDLEFDTDQAECREEKRWMDRQNAKRIKARKLEESARIRQLTDLAYKNDPRIRREKEETKKKKEAEKEARRKRKEEEETRKHEEEEKIRREEEQRTQDEKQKRAQAKREKDEARKVIRKARQKLRSVARDLELSDPASIAAIEKMCHKGDVTTIEALVETLVRNSNGVPVSNVEVAANIHFPNITEIVEEALANVGTPASDENVKKSVQGEDCASNSNSSVLANGDKTSNGVGPVAVPWTREEMSLLSKGLGKFPGGTKNRWERLAHYIGTRSEDEVITQVQSMRSSNVQGKSASRAKRSEDGGSKAPKRTSARDQVPSKKKVPNKLSFTTKQQKQLEAAMKKYSSESGAAKWAKIASEVNDRSASECEDRVSELTAFYRSSKRATS